MNVSVEPRLEYAGSHIRARERSFGSMLHARMTRGPPPPAQRKTMYGQQLNNLKHYINWASKCLQLNT